MIRTIHTQPKAQAFEVRIQTDLVGLVDFLREEVLNKPEKMAEVIVQVSPETRVPVRHSHKSRIEPADSPRSEGRN